MNAQEKTFGSPSGEPSTTRSMFQQKCEKLWTLPVLQTDLQTANGRGPLKPHLTNAVQITFVQADDGKLCDNQDCALQFIG